MTYSRQSGMTLIELMIAGVLSLIVSYFMMNIMMTTARTANLAEGLSQAQETGRLVMTWMNDALAEAGYNSNYLNNESFSAVAELCIGSAVPPNNGAHCTFNTNSNANGGDRIAIRRTAGGLTPSAQDLQTCGGESLSAPLINEQAEIIDVYWVSPNNTDTDTKNDYQLRCVTYDKDGVPQGTAQSIANGIESMQILLGVGDSNGNVTNFVAPSDTVNWSDVVAVRIALLAREFGNNTLPSDTRTYGLLDSDPVTYLDQTARYIQNGTIWFPNTKKM